MGIDALGGQYLQRVKNKDKVKDTDSNKESGSSKENVNIFDEDFVEKFKQYLISKGKIKKADLNKDSINIFDYSSELKTFLTKQDGVNLSSKGLSVEDLIQKLNESENEDAMEFLEQARDDFESEDAANVIDFLSFMFEDEEFMDIVDADGNDKIDKSELATFLTEVSGNDRDKKDITLRDLVEGGSDVREGKFELPKVKDWDSIIEDTGVDVTDGADSASAAGGGGGGSVGGTSGTSGSAGTEKKEVSLTDSIKETAKNYNGKTIEELEGLRSEEETKLSDQQKTYNKIIDEANGPLSGEKKIVDDSYEAFLDAVNANDGTRKDISDRQKHIAELDLYINEKIADFQDKRVQSAGLQTRIESLTTQIATTEQSVQQLEASKAALTGEDAESQKSQIDSQIASLNTLIEDLKEQKTKTEEDKRQLDESITALQEDITETSDAREKAAQDLTDMEEALYEGNEAAEEKHKAYLDLQQQYENSFIEATNKAMSSINTANQNIQAIELQMKQLRFETSYNAIINDKAQYNKGDLTSTSAAQPKQDNPEEPKQEDETA